MGAINSRNKGKRGELEVRNLVRDFWNADACIRAAQANGAYSADLLYALPGSHIEVKRRRSIAAWRYLRQAMEDCEDDELPIVLMREDRSPWVFMCPLVDTPAFARRLLRQLGDIE